MKKISDELRNKIERSSSRNLLSVFQYIGKAPDAKHFVIKINGEVYRTSNGKNMWGSRSAAISALYNSSTNRHEDFPDPDSKTLKHILDELIKRDVIVIESI